MHYYWKPLIWLFSYGFHKDNGAMGSSSGNPGGACGVMNGHNRCNERLTSWDMGPYLEDHPTDHNLLATGVSSPTYKCWITLLRILGITRITKWDEPPSRTMVLFCNLWAGLRPLRNINKARSWKSGAGETWIRVKQQELQLDLPNLGLISGCD